MQRPIPALSPGEPDPVLLERAGRVGSVASAGAVVIAVVSLVRWCLPISGRIFPPAWQFMYSLSAVCIVLAVVSLTLQKPPYARRHILFARVVSILIMLMAASAVAESALHLQWGIENLLPPYGAGATGLAHHIAPQTAACFVILGLLLIFVQAPKQAKSHLADTLTVLLSLLILTLLSGYLFGAVHIFGVASQELVSLPTLLSIALLTVAIGARRAEFGFFSIMLGRGIGSRIVRLLFPIMIVVPFLRESVRARLISRGFGVHYITAALASLAVIVAEALVFWLAWRIHDMELEIHDLTLRDALTGLYNLRGFYLLAEQALRLAQRSGLPFTVIFVDLDNLKLVNDTLGHDTGSQFLAETAAILNDAFRESDVLGRVGGDEFAVAGQFGQLAVSLAIERLEAALEQRNAELNFTLPLSFSIGYSISASALHETLDELISRADREMYRNKRERKAGVA